MATILRDGDLSLLSGKVAVIGYGAQGHAHALNLRDSGVNVVVGLREGGASWPKAEAAGLAVATVAAAVKGAQLVAILIPDQVQPEVFDNHVAPNLEPDAAVLFAHGFNILYERVRPSESHDVIMVAPKGPGDVVRRLFTEGYGTPALIAVEQDPSGRARDLALAYAVGIGAGRAGICIDRGSSTSTCRTPSATAMGANVTCAKPPSAWRSTCITRATAKPAG